VAEIVSNPGADGYPFPVDLIGILNYVKSKLVFGVDGTAIDVTPATGFPVMNAGGTGVDWSANQPDYPPARMELLSTVDANPTRSAVGVVNQDVSILQIWRDDGDGDNLTLIPLGACESQGDGTGGSYYSKTFKGRLRIWGATIEIQMAAYED